MKLPRPTRLQWGCGPHWPTAVAISLLVCGTLAPAGWSQSRGWHLPLSDGLYGFRYGMDSGSVRARAHELGMKPLPPRPNTLRYGRSIRGQDAEVVFTFPEGGRSQLYRILVRWPEMKGTPTEVREYFDYFDAALQARFGEPVHATDPDLVDVLNAYRKVFHVYEGPETEAQITLWAPAPGQLRVDLMLDCRQLRP